MPHNVATDFLFQHPANCPHGEYFTEASVDPDAVAKREHTIEQHGTLPKGAAEEQADGVARAREYERVKNESEEARVDQLGPGC
tara:strand:+ start:1011 stop:1262 length:252 start_codon:yes stop_codon:yes gene_type:complete